MSDSDSPNRDQPSKEDPDKDAPSEDQAGESEAPQAPAGTEQQVTANDAADRAKVAQFVTTIKNAEQQVGEHIIQALQHEDTVAVLTTVALSRDGQQRVISAALNPERMQQVQEILLAAEKEREEEEPCLGFHCLVKPKMPQTTPQQPDTGQPDTGQPDTGKPDMGKPTTDDS